MRVIILKDTPKVGRKDDVKDIPDGYVMNSLMPKGIVERATPQTLKLLEERKTRIIVEKEIDEKMLQKGMDDLKKITLTISEKANEKGHLFSSVTKDKIKQELENKERVIISEEMIILNHAIKECGMHKIDVAFKGNHLY